MSDKKRSVERGQSITFRVPSDTPDHLLRQLSNIKDTEKRNFSSKVSEFVLQGVRDTLAKEKETVTISLPKPLTKEQRNWLKHEHSEALLGSILYQLMMDPVRATTLLASLNSNAYDIDEALYLQEEIAATQETSPVAMEQTEPAIESDQEEPTLELDQEEQMQSKDAPDDLDDLNLDHLQDDLRSHEDEPPQQHTEDDDDLLGDFLSSMNK